MNRSGTSRTVVKELPRCLTKRAASANAKGGIAPTRSPMTPKKIRVSQGSLISHLNRVPSQLLAKPERHTAERVKNEEPERDGESGCVWVQ